MARNQLNFLRAVLLFLILFWASISKSQTQELLWSDTLKTNNAKYNIMHLFYKGSSVLKLANKKFSELHLLNIDKNTFDGFEAEDTISIQEVKLDNKTSGIILKWQASDWRGHGLWSTENRKIQIWDLKRKKLVFEFEPYFASHAYGYIEEAISQDTSEEAMPDVEEISSCECFYNFCFCEKGTLLIEPIKIDDECDKTNSVKVGTYIFKEGGFIRVD